MHTCHLYFDSGTYDINCTIPLCLATYRCFLVGVESTGQIVEINTPRIITSSKHICRKIVFQLVFLCFTELSTTIYLHGLKPCLQFENLDAAFPKALSSDYLFFVTNLFKELLKDQFIKKETD